MASADLPQPAPDTRPGAHLPLPRVLRNLWIGSLAITSLTLIVGYIQFRMGLPKLRYNPLSEAPFGDLTEYLRTFQFVHTTAFYRSPYAPSVAYPPVGAVLYALVYKCSHPIALYLVIAAIWLLGAIVFVRRTMIARGIAPLTATLFPATLVLVSFPIAGLLERANIELFLWIFASLGTWAYVRRRDDLAAILWGLAAATKLYPLIFLALLIPRRHYRALAAGVVSFAGSSLLAMLYLGPNIPTAWHGSLQNVFGYQGLRAAQWNVHELAANHSAYSFAKFAAFLAGLPIAKLTLPYYAVGAAVFAAFFFLRIARLPAANQVLAVSTYMVMLPSVSYFYALVHLYAPLVLLILVALDAARSPRSIPGLKRTLLLFVPICASYMLFTYPSRMMYGGLIQGALIMLLFLFSAAYPFGTAETPA